MKDKNVTIEFSTLNVPAPFAHDYVLNLSISSAINAKYKIAFKGREDLSEEEILEEGYSMDDDFEWEGIIDASWMDQIMSLICLEGQTEGQTLNEFTQTELSITVNEGNQKNKSIFYDDEVLGYKIQEIVQALFETSKRELPLQFKFLYIGKGEKDQFEITLSFAKRNCTILKNGKPFKTLTWEDGSSLMSLIYQPDYILDLAKTKKDGLYISFEENAWFSVEEIEESERISGFKNELLKFLT